VINDPKAAKVTRAAKALTILGVFCLAFGGYMYFSETGKAAEMDSRLAAETKKLDQAKQDAENVDPTGNFHRIQGDRVVQVFSHRLQQAAKDSGVQVEKASQDKNVDPYLPVSGGKQPPTGWGMVKYEFELSGPTRAVMGVVREMTSSGLAFEIEVINLMRKPGNSGSGEILGKFTVHLVTRGGTPTPPPPAGGTS